MDFFQVRSCSLVFLTLFMHICELLLLYPAPKYNIYENSDKDKVCYCTNLATPECTRTIPTNIDMALTRTVSSCQRVNMQGRHSRSSSLCEDLDGAWPCPGTGSPASSGPASGTGPGPGDEAVKGTNDEASECKRSAAGLGYWRDAYLPYLIRRGERKAPEINRGYFARLSAVDIFVDKFLKKTGSECQIINLGCGFDTLYWRLRDLNQVVTNFIEMDFPSVTARKCQAIKKNKILMDKIHAEDGEVIIREGDLHADGYYLLGCDLRCLAEVQRKIDRTAVRYDLPTLFIAECVLVYLKPDPCTQLLKWISSHFAECMIVNYEQVNLKDKFGEVMLSNLSARGCPLAGAEFCTSLDTQNQRFLNCGFTAAKSWDMETVWNALPIADRRRVESIEMLDERELLTQLFQHYCIAVASKGSILTDISLNT